MATTCSTQGVARVRVPVLSKTMVSAWEMASRNLPPFTVSRWRLASLMADRVATGMATSMAQEKSTMSTEAAFVTLRVSSQARTAVPKV